MWFRYFCRRHPYQRWGVTHPSFSTTPARCQPFIPPAHPWCGQLTDRSSALQSAQRVPPTVHCHHPSCPASGYLFRCSSGAFSTFSVFPESRQTALRIVSALAPPPAALDSASSHGVHPTPFTAHASRRTTRPAVLVSPSCDRLAYSAYGSPASLPPLLVCVCVLLALSRSAPLLGFGPILPPDLVLRPTQPGLASPRVHVPRPTPPVACCTAGFSLAACTCACLAIATAVFVCIVCTGAWVPDCLVSNATAIACARVHIANMNRLARLGCLLSPWDWWPYFCTCRGASLCAPWCAPCSFVRMPSPARPRTNLASSGGLAPCCLDKPVVDLPSLSRSFMQPAPSDRHRSSLHRGCGYHSHRVLRASPDYRTTRLPFIGLRSSLSAFDFSPKHPSLLYRQLKRPTSSAGHRTLGCTFANACSGTGNSLPIRGIDGHFAATFAPIAPTQRMGNGALPNRYHTAVKCCVRFLLHAANHRFHRCPFRCFVSLSASSVLHRVRNIRCRSTWFCARPDVAGCFRSTPT